MVTLLIALAIGVMVLKVTELGLPLLPKDQEPVWSVEAKIAFEGKNQGAIVDVDIPDELNTHIVLEEYFVARNYGLNIERQDQDRRVEWSTRRARGKQALYYRIDLAPMPGKSGLSKSQPGNLPAPPASPKYPEPLASAVNEFLSEVRADSANVFTFASQALVKIAGSPDDSNVELLMEHREPGSEPWIERIIYILAGARISARMVRGVLLEDNTTQYELLPWLEVHNGKRWEGFNPVNGNKGYPENFLRWSFGPQAVINLDNGSSPQLTFAVSKYAQPVAQVAKERASASRSWLGKTLLNDLPVSTQNVYRTLLVIPIGALIVAFVRTVIGIPTLGTFMPILIAIAFRETELAWGIFLFTTIAGVGLMLRFYLEHLHLLLVPRLCAVLIFVILMMLAVSLISANFGFDKGFSVALFPIVILTMVIEHMSITWEESGALVTFKQAIGSLLVAIVGFLAMSNEKLNHIVFMFPEVLLIALAFAIILGRYTGYRATELVRFRDIASGPL